MRVKHPDFPAYWIHADGTITRACDSVRYQKADDVVKGRIVQSGYRQHKLTDMWGNQRLVRTNRLVCEAFWGRAISPMHQAAHKDGNRLNNAADNLYWATPKQNKADSIRHGTVARGQRVGNAKLTEENVKAILGSYNGRRGDLANMSREYGVSINSIRRVLTGLTWAHVTGRGNAQASKAI